MGMNEDSKNKAFIVDTFVKSTINLLEKYKKTASDSEENKEKNHSYLLHIQPEISKNDAPIDIMIEHLKKIERWPADIFPPKEIFFKLDYKIIHYLNNTDFESFTIEPYFIFRCQQEDLMFSIKFNRLPEKETPEPLKFTHIEYRPAMCIIDKQPTDIFINDFFDKMIKSEKYYEIQNKSSLETSRKTSRFFPIVTYSGGTNENKNDIIKTYLDPLIIFLKQYKKKHVDDDESKSYFFKPLPEIQENTQPIETMINYFESIKTWPSNLFPSAKEFNSLASHTITYNPTTGKNSLAFSFSNLSSKHKFYITDTNIDSSVKTCSITFNQSKEFQQTKTAENISFADPSIFSYFYTKKINDLQIDLNISNRFYLEKPTESTKKKTIKDKKGHKTKTFFPTILFLQGTTKDKKNIVREYVDPLIKSLQDYIKTADHGNKSYLLNKTKLSTQNTPADEMLKRLESIKRWKPQNFPTFDRFEKNDSALKISPDNIVKEELRKYKKSLAYKRIDTITGTLLQKINIDFVDKKFPQIAKITYLQTTDENKLITQNFFITDELETIVKSYAEKSTIDSSGNTITKRYPIIYFESSAYNQTLTKLVGSLFSYIPNMLQYLTKSSIPDIKASANPFITDTFFIMPDQDEHPSQDPHPKAMTEGLFGILQCPTRGITTKSLLYSVCYWFNPNLKDKNKDHLMATLLEYGTNDAKKILDTNWEIHDIKGTPFVYLISKSILKQKRIAQKILQQQCLKEKKTSPLANNKDEELDFLLGEYRTKYPIVSATTIIEKPTKYFEPLTKEKDETIIQEKPHIEILLILLQKLFIDYSNQTFYLPRKYFFCVSAHGAPSIPKHLSPTSSAIEGRIASFTLNQFSELLIFCASRAPILITNTCFGSGNITKIPPDSLPNMHIISATTPDTLGFALATPSGFQNFYTEPLLYDSDYWEKPENMARLVGYIAPMVLTGAKADAKHLFIWKSPKSRKWRFANIPQKIFLLNDILSCQKKHFHINNLYTDRNQMGLHVLGKIYPEAVIIDNYNVQCSLTFDKKKNDENYYFKIISGPPGDAFHTFNGTFNVPDFTLDEFKKSFLIRQYAVYKSFYIKHLRAKDFEGSLFYFNNRFDVNSSESIIATKDLTDTVMWNWEAPWLEDHKQGKQTDTPREIMKGCARLFSKKLEQENMKNIAAEIKDKKISDELTELERTWLFYTNFIKAWAKIKKWEEEQKKKDEELRIQKEKKEISELGT